MKKRLNRLWMSGRESAASQADRALENTCTGRVVSALTYIMVIFCLGLWITAFLLFKDQLFTETISGKSLTNLTCVIFFGGLVAALYIGALAGNFLRRAFWKILVRRKK